MGDNSKSSCLNFDFDLFDVDLRFKNDLLELVELFNFKSFKLILLKINILSNIKINI